jgi:hypothetical protein
MTTVLKGDFSMLKMNVSNISRKLNRRVARVSALLVLAGALVAMPLGLPGTTNTTEAGCFTWADSQCDLVGHIYVTWNGGNSYDIAFQGAEGTLWQGICGAGEVQPLNVSPCGYASSVAQHIINVQACDSSPFTVGYRIVAYPGGDSNNSRKWHSQITIAPYFFTYVGETLDYGC